MERLVIQNKAGSLCYNDTDEGLKLEPNEITSHQRRLLLERLHEYEDSGLTPKQIEEMKGPVKKLQKYFGDTITAGQVIDFFMDYYIAQGDPKQVEDAVLLTNEDAARYRVLNKRDIGVKPIFSDGWDMCGNCGERITPVDSFCSECGQRLRWEE